jgi:hypothetical protein
MTQRKPTPFTGGRMSHINMIELNLFLESIPSIFRLVLCSADIPETQS